MKKAIYLLALVAMLTACTTQREVADEIFEAGGSWLDEITWKR